MKRTFTTTILLLIFLAGFVEAQDTVVVDPGLNTLADALEDPANEGKVFKLTRGGFYANERILWPADTSSCTIVGEAGPADQPPAMIQRYTTAGAAAWDVLFAIGSSESSHVKFENIFFWCYSQLGEQFLGSMDIFAGGGGSVEMNNCIIDGANWASLFVESNGVDIILKNNIFLNSTNRSFYQQGHLYEGWGMVGTTAKVYNNTMVNFGGTGNGDGVRLEMADYNHNTWYLVDRVVSSEGWMGHFDRKYENSISVDCYARGYVGARPTWKEHPDSTTYFLGDNGEGVPPSYLDSTESIVVLDSLFVHLGDSALLDSDSEREVSISNNLNFNTQTLLDYHAQITATTVPFLNNKAKLMIETYDNLVAENNIDGTLNPDFVQPLPASAYEEYFKNTYQRRHLGERTDEYPYMELWNWSDLDDMGAGYNITWPIPLDLKPQAPEVDGAGKDGYPLGDLNWWGDDIVAMWEAGEDYPTGIIPGNNVKNGLLSQNYPNPFSTHTLIVFQLEQEAMVSIDVYNISGQKVRTLFSERHPQGIGEVSWDGRNENGRQLNPGAYFYSLTVDGKLAATRKLVKLDK